MIRWIFVLIIVSFGACKTTSQVKKVENVGFSAPKVALKKANKFADSKYRRDMSMLDFSANQPPHKRKDVMVVTPDLGYDWRGLLYKNPDIRYFLITPGDYRKWGDLRPMYSGTAEQPYIFRYYNPKAAQPYNTAHPVKRKIQGKEAVLERFQFNGVSHWVMHGLTFRGQATEKDGKHGGMYSCFWGGSNHNIIDYCLVEQVVWGNAIRISDGSHNSVQRCVIRDKIEGFTGDNIGVTIDATVGKKARDNRVVDCEIYNVTDAVQLVYQVKMGRNAPITGEVPGTIIDNNDMYITKKLYRYKDGQELACAENGIDIKVGTASLADKDKVRIINNRIWGYRTTDQTCSGVSNGTAIGIHRNASNILVENNIIFDVPRGVGVAGKSTQFPGDNVSHITVRNNILYNINSTADNSGFAFVAYSDAQFTENTVKKTKYYLLTPSDVLSVFNNNLVIDAEQKIPNDKRVKCSFEQNSWVKGKTLLKEDNALQNNTKNRTSKITQQADLGDFIFYVKRWTKPERIIIPKVLNQ